MRLLTLFTAVVVALGACDAGTSQESAPVDDGAGLSGLIERTAASTTRYQEGLLRDGVVSAADYVQAVEAARDCVRDAGWEVDDTFVTPDGFTRTFSIVWNRAPTEEQERQITQAAAATMDRCKAAYSNDVEYLWVQSNIPTGAERVAGMARLIECLETLGVTGLDVASDEDEVVGAVVEQLSGDARSDGFFCLDSNFLVLTTPDN